MRNGAVTGADRSTFTVAASGVSVPITLTVTAHPETSAVLGLPGGTNRNYAVDQIVTGPPSEHGLLLQHHHSDVGGVMHTFTFSRPVSNLRLRLAGMSLDRQGQDRMATSGTGFTAVATPGSEISAGRGLFFPQAWVLGLAPTDPRGQLVLEHAETLSDQGFHFSSANLTINPVNTREMYIGDISFTVA